MTGVDDHVIVGGLAVSQLLTLFDAGNLYLDRLNCYCGTGITVL